MSVSVESDTDFWGIPRSASSIDKKIMIEWTVMNSKCTMPNVPEDRRSCEARDSDKRVLGASGWCWDFDEFDVTYDDHDSWHRCSSERVASIARTLRADRTYPGMPAFKREAIPAILAEAAYEAEQNCGGLSSLEGRSGLEDQMRDINTRDFPHEPGIWPAAQEWMQRLLNATLARSTAKGCAISEHPGVGGGRSESQRDGPPYSQPRTTPNRLET